MNIFQQIFNRLEALTGGIVEFASTPGNHKILKAADGKRYYPRLRSELNSFLRTWLKNLENQGFYRRPKGKAGSCQGSENRCLARGGLIVG